MDRHYEALGLSPSADEREVRRAYRRLLKEHHPDQGGSRDRFLRINEAYEEIVGERPPPAPETDGGSIPEHAGPTPIDGADPTYDPAARTETVPDHETLGVDGQYLHLTLAALVQRVSLERLVDGHVPAATERPVAFFHAENATGTTLSWNGTQNTAFVGDDGFLYEASNIVTPHADRLPERWCGRDVEIGPRRALDAVVIAQELPEDVTVEKVIYTHHPSTADGETDRPSEHSSASAPSTTPDDDTAGETERYLFDLRPLVRERLNRLPFRR